MPAPTNRNSDKFMLRLPDGMRNEIAAEAERNGRSMNAEIVHRLEQSFAPADIDALMNLSMLPKNKRNMALRVLRAIMDVDSTPD